MDCILAIFLILVFLASIIVNIWAIKVNSKEQGKNTMVIYLLYKELKRYNDNLQMEEKRK